MLKDFLLTAGVGNNAFQGTPINTTIRPIIVAAGGKELTLPSPLLRDKHLFSLQRNEGPQSFYAPALKKDWDRLSYLYYSPI